MLTLAGRIAIAWTLLSLLLTAVWVLLLEVGRRFWSRADSKPPACEARQRTAQIRAIYADFCHEDLAGGETLVHCEPDESAGSDAIVLYGCGPPHAKSEAIRLFTVRTPKRIGRSFVMFSRLSPWTRVTVGLCLRCRERKWRSMRRTRAMPANSMLMCSDLKAEMASLAKKGVSCTVAQEARWGSVTTVRLPGGGQVGRPISTETFDGRPTRVRSDNVAGNLTIVGGDRER
jgi:hypothetical protein